MRNPIARGDSSARDRHVSTPDAAPLLIYDGDCGFCERCASFVRRRCPGVDVVAYQTIDLPALGLTEAHAAAAALWVETGHRVREGYDAVVASLLRAGPWWATVGRTMRLRPIAAVGRWLYPFVSRHRHRLPGGTASCRSPSS